ncbi:MAG: efflux RND transporter periplasmic adaptor subunit [Ignavibacteriae bacterium]|nr:MAG: efflux RND transporter periplasmic adaptor subunit [Ignavibacteriota bacterium]
MKKSFYIYGSVVVVVIIGVILLFARSKNNNYDFRFDKVTQGDLTVYVTATGTINAVISVDVGTQVSGIVAKLYADFNSIVRKGQIIAQIDSTFLVQSVKDAEANLDKAKAQYSESKRNLDREKTLFDRGLDSQINYDAAVTTNESNSANLKSAEAALDRAKINLAYATIYAPIDGVVINRAVNIGQTVAASFSSPTLFTIANDLKKMQVQTTVDESDVGRISIGQEATFTVDAYPDETFSGIVSQIRLAPQSIQNVVNYIVIIDVHNDQLKLMPGMTANVKILVANASNVLKVSNMALRFQPASDIIDTTGTGSMRNSFSGKRDTAVDSSSRQNGPQEAAGPQDHVQPSPADRERFRAVRDSIQSAHGGKLSPEEVRGEMQKFFAGKLSRRTTPAAPPPATSKMFGTAGKFGITSMYPEYQKSSYVPSHQSGRGRVWMLKSNGLLESVFVRTGLNDGRFTEINSMKLKPGDQIVIGATSNNGAAAEQARSPLTGQGQGQRGGGFR